MKVNKSTTDVDAYTQILVCPHTLMSMRFSDGSEDSRRVAAWWLTHANYWLLTITWIL